MKLERVRLYDLRAEATSEQNSAANGLQLGEGVNALQSGVVLDRHVTLDVLESLERDVGQLMVLGQSERVLHEGEVVGRHGLQTGAVLEADTANLLKDGGIEALNDTEVKLSGGLEHGHVDLHVIGIVGEGQQGGDVLELGVERLQLTVVVDGHFVDGGNIQAAQVANPSVGDENLLRLGDTRCAKSEAVQGGKMRQRKRVDALKLLHVERRKGLEGIEHKLATNGGDGAAGDTNEAARIGNGQALHQLLRPIELQGARHR